MNFLRKFFKKPEILSKHIKETSISSTIGIAQKVSNKFKNVTKENSVRTLIDEDLTSEDIFSSLTKLSNTKIPNQSLEFKDR